MASEAVSMMTDRFGTHDELIEKDQHDAEDDCRNDKRLQVVHVGDGYLQRVEECVHNQAEEAAEEHCRSGDDGHLNGREHDECRATRLIFQTEGFHQCPCDRHHDCCSNG